MDGLSSLLKQSKVFVSAMLRPLSSLYAFHNLEHTKGVVRAARIIGRASKLSEVELATVMIAAWFHDVGYSLNNKDHEQNSISIAVSTLTNWGASQQLLADVSSAILATKPPQRPSHTIDMVLCDADLAHLGSSQYAQHASRLRTELQNLQGYTFETECSWLITNLEFMKNHKYFTPYGKSIIEMRKQANISNVIHLLHNQAHS